MRQWQWLVEQDAWGSARCVGLERGLCEDHSRSYILCDGDSLPLRKLVVTTRSDLSERLRDAARPMNHDVHVGHVGPQAEMKAFATLGQKAIAGSKAADEWARLVPASSCQLHGRPDRISVAFGTHKLKANPRAPRKAIVHESHLGRRATFDPKIEVAVQVPVDHADGPPVLGKIEAADSRYVSKLVSRLIQVAAVSFVPAEPPSAAHEFLQQCIRLCTANAAIDR